MTDKHLETVRARAALCGVALEAIRDDNERPAYVVTLGALTERLESLEAVEAWLDALPSSVALPRLLEGVNA